MALWFDVGKEQYTTQAAQHTCSPSLWFDVGKEQYTTQQQ